MRGYKYFIRNVYFTSGRYRIFVHVLTVSFMVPCLGINGTLVNRETARYEGAQYRSVYDSRRLWSESQQIPTFSGEIFEPFF